MFPFIAGSSALCLLTLLWAETGAGEGQGQLQSWERSGLGGPGPAWAEIKPGLCLHTAAAGVGCGLKHPWSVLGPGQGCHSLGGEMGHAHGRGSPR